MRTTASSIKVLLEMSVTPQLLSKTVMVMTALFFKASIMQAVTIQRRLRKAEMMALVMSIKAAERLMLQRLHKQATETLRRYSKLVTVTTQLLFKPMLIIHLLLRKRVMIMSPMLTKLA